MPTIKQKQVFEKVVKGSSISKAMKEVGYAKSTSKRTNKITRTNGWNELLEKHISDDKLTKVLEDGLEADRSFGEDTQPDYAVRHKYLETGLKLKSKFPDPKLNIGASDDLKETLIKLNKLLG